MKPENYKYHLAIRLKGYNYSNPGIYFITICSKDRSCVFGKIDGRQSVLNEIGLAVEKLWMQIPEHFPDVSLMDYVLMPNHLHGLLCINEKVIGTACRASTWGNQASESFGSPMKGSIPLIIRSLKSASTKYIHQNFKYSGLSFWQPGYYEHVIRNDIELKYTINYIKSNPANWDGS